MSDSNPSSNPAAGQAPSSSSGHSLFAMFILCSIYALIGIGAGFWLGRHGFNQTFKPAVPTTPSAAAVAEQVKRISPKAVRTSLHEAKLVTA